MSTHHLQLESVSALASKGTGGNDSFIVVNLMNHHVLSHSQGMRWHTSTGILNSQMPWTESEEGLCFCFFINDIFSYVGLLRDICVYACAYVYMCMCAGLRWYEHVSAGAHGSQALDLLELVFQGLWVTQHGCWVPDSDPLLSAVHILNSWAVSPVPPHLVFCN